MMLSDGTLAEMGARMIEPFAPQQLQPSGYELSLSNQVRVPVSPEQACEDGWNDRIDLRKGAPVGYTDLFTLPESGWTISPGQFLLACSEETVRLPSNIAAHVDGKSSLGRLGIAVHVTAGFIDPGFSGQITFEVVNLAPWEVTIYPRLPFAQLTFWQLDQEARSAYGDSERDSHYQGQAGPTESRYGHARARGGTTRWNPLE
jgi:dCTP deaminase